MNEGILSSIFDDIENMNNITQDEFKTCLESIESDLRELDSIDQSIEEAEKASFESIIEDINLFNNIIAYRNIKSGVALESVSSEFGIANEGIKELAEKGMDGLKAIGAKLMQVLKTILSFLKLESKTVREIRKKIKLSEKDLKYVHKHTNNKDIFKKLYNPDRFFYIMNKELVLSKFIFKDLDYEKWADRLNGIYISQDISEAVKNRLIALLADFESDDIIEYLTYLVDNKNPDPEKKINLLNDFFSRYEKIKYTESNNPYDYDGFDFLNNIYVLTDLIEFNSKKLTAKIDGLINKMKVLSVVSDSRKKYGEKNFSEVINLLVKYKNEHKINISEYVKYCGEYLKEVKKYEHLDKETGSRTVASAKDDAKFDKFHYKAMKPDSFEFKTFDFDDE